MKRLRLGAVLHFIIAIGHLGCLFALNETFDAYGIKDVMYNMVFGQVCIDSNSHYRYHRALQPSSLGGRLGLCGGFQMAAIYFIRHSGFYSVVLLSWFKKLSSWKYQIGLRVSRKVNAHRS